MSLRMTLRMGLDTGLRKSFSVLALVVMVLAFGSCSADEAGGGDTTDRIDTGDSSGTSDSDGFVWDTGAEVAPDAEDSGGEGAQGDDVQGEGTGVDTTPPPDGTTTDGDSSETTNPGGNFFPANELLIVIMGPGPGKTASVLGNITSLGGAVFGQYDTITWTNTTNGASGEGIGAPFWKTGPVNLANGDNHLVVEAVHGDEISRDEISVTYNPGFRWDKKLEVRPPALFVGDSFGVIVTSSMGFYTNFNPNSVTLLEVDANGQTIKELGTMRDDGGANTGSTSGDEYPSDGVYTAKVTLSSQSAKTIYMRASAQVTAGATTYTAYSEIMTVPILNHLTKTDCESMLQLTTTVHAQHAEALSQTGSASQARDQIIESLQGNPLVAEVGAASKNGDGVWVLYANGILGGFSFVKAGSRGGDEGDDLDDDDADYPEEELESFTAPLGGPTLGSKGVSLFSPFNQDFTGTDETAEFASRMSDQSCPPFQVDGPLYGASASLSKFGKMHKSGIVSIVTHGDALFDELSPAARAGFGFPSDESIEVLWSGEAPVCDNLQQSLDSCSINQGDTAESVCPTGQYCLVTQNSGNTVSGLCYDVNQVDLRTGRLAFGSTYGILPDYVQAHADPTYPNSLVYLGACDSMFNGGMAAAFFAMGAKTVFGYNGEVSSAFAYEQGLALAEKLLVEKTDTGGAFTYGQSDPANPTTVFQTFGANNLDVNNGDMVNPSFEMGNLTGWTPSGDGRVISKLGATGPVAGKFMGVVSTGMGYTLQVGAMKQTFCIPPDKNTVQFYWNYFSEEFQEFCGSEYQDPFTAALKSSAGNISMTDVTVDSLCPSSACFGCGGQFVGVYESDVDFDQGDAWYTRWQKSQTNISSLTAQEKPVELQFFVTDEGDSIYDTVILVDDIRFLTQ